MQNLIKNSCWMPGPGGSPLYFSNTGPITYDDFTCNGNNTCSLTMPQDNCGKASNHYDLPIDVHGKHGIIWGYCIRAIDAESIALTAGFYGRHGDLIRFSRVPITKRVTYCFSRQTACFDVPRGAESVQLSLQFSGKITACTFCAPNALYSHCAI